MSSRVRDKRSKVEFQRSLGVVGFIRTFTYSFSFRLSTKSYEGIRGPSPLRGARFTDLSLPRRLPSSQSFSSSPSVPSPVSFSQVTPPSCTVPGFLTGPVPYKAVGSLPAHPNSRLFPFRRVVSVPFGRSHSLLPGPYRPLDAETDLSSPTRSDRGRR